jgi:drug/metabolite transporter (DMT)-like permease
MQLNTAMAAFWIAPLLLFAADRRTAAVPGNWVAVLVGFSGVLLVLHPGASISAAGLAFAAGMAVCFSGYLILTRRLNGELEITNLFYTAFWVLIAMSFHMPRVWRRPSVHSLLVAVFIGIAGLAALYALDVSLKRTPPASIAAAFYLQPAFAALLQPVWSRNSIQGIVLICGGVAIQAASAHRSSRCGARA